MKLAFTLSVFVLLVAWGFLSVPYPLDKANLSREDSVKEMREEEEEEHIPMLIVSADEVYQGGTLGFEVSPAETPLRALWGEEEVPTFKTRDGYAGAVGVALDEPESKKILHVTASGGETLQKSISVRAKSYGVSRLSLPQKAQDAGETPVSLVKNIVVNDNAKLTDATQDSPDETYFKEHFVIPVSLWVDVGGFGVVRESGGSAIRHLGVDLEAQTGDDVYAINDGKVVLADMLTNYGNSIIIDHGQGVWSLYLHLSKMEVVHGERAERGEKIGEAGETGLYSFSPHLHFSIRMRGKSLDPKAFIDAMNAVLQ